MSSAGGHSRDEWHAAREIAPVDSLIPAGKRIRGRILGSPITIPPCLPLPHQQPPRTASSVVYGCHLWSVLSQPRLTAPLLIMQGDLMHFSLPPALVAVGGNLCK